MIWVLISIAVALAGVSIWLAVSAQRDEEREAEVRALTDDELKQTLRDCIAEANRRSA